MNTSVHSFRTETNYRIIVSVRPKVSVLLPDRARHSVLIRSVGWGRFPGRPRGPDGVTGGRRNRSKAPRNEGPLPAPARAGPTLRPGHPDHVVRRLGVPLGAVGRDRSVPAGAVVDVGEECAPRHGVALRGAGPVVGVSDRYRTVRTPVAVLGRDRPEPRSRATVLVIPVVGRPVRPGPRASNRAAPSAAIRGPVVMRYRS